jgi:hypothetical protein
LHRSSPARNILLDDLLAAEDQRSNRVGEGRKRKEERLCYAGASIPKSSNILTALSSKAYLHGYKPDSLEHSQQLCIEDSFQNRMKDL